MACIVGSHRYGIPDESATAPMTLNLENGMWGAWAAPRICRWGYKTGFASGASEKKICTPTFPNVGGTSKQISV